MPTYMENMRRNYTESGWPHVREVREMSGTKVCVTYTYICNPYTCTMHEITCHIYVACAVSCI